LILLLRVIHTKPLIKVKIRKNTAKIERAIFCFLNSFLVSIALKVNVNKNRVSINMIIEKIPFTNLAVKSRILHTSTPRLLKNVRSDTVLEFNKTNVKKPHPIIKAANNAAPKNPKI
jgi:hypothetical protein